MDKAYKVIVCFANRFPVSRGFRQNMFSGIVTFGPDSITLKQNRYLLRKAVAITLPYGDIDSYLHSFDDLYLNHHNGSLPKLLMIKAHYYNLHRIAEIERALEKHGIASAKS